VLGLALAAAAAAKFMEGGVAWVLNGSVKYHVLTDIDQAPVDWGIRFALHPAMAIALSFGALAVESLMLPAAFAKQSGIRLAAALAAAALFAGFWAFHGLFWPWWWILLLAFAPWHRVYPVRTLPSPPAPAAGAPAMIRLRHVQATVLVAAIAQQIAASAWALEVPPVLSAYDMYSKTYSSPEEYVQNAATGHWLVADMDNKTMHACAVSETDARLIAASSTSVATSGHAGDVLARCFPDLVTVRTLAVEQAQRDVDWASGQYRGTTRVRIAGPVPLDRIP
jgi:hypothetical protein